MGLLPGLDGGKALRVDEPLRLFVAYE